MPSFYCWTLRLFLAVSLALLIFTISAVWPDTDAVEWTDVAGLATLTVAMVSVAAWTIGAWLDSPN